MYILCLWIQICAELRDLVLCMYWVRELAKILCITRGSQPNFVHEIYELMAKKADLLLNSIGKCSSFVTFYGVSALFSSMHAFSFFSMRASM